MRFRVPNGEVPPTWYPECLSAVSGEHVATVLHPRIRARFFTEISLTPCISQTNGFLFSATAETAIHFNYLGNTGSTVVLKGIPNSSYSVYPAEYGKTINPTLQIDGNVYFTDGTSSGKTTFSTVTGSGGFYFSTKNWHINTVTNFTGSLGAKQADATFPSTRSRLLLTRRFLSEINWSR